MINLTKKVVACLNHHRVLLVEFRTNLAEETRNVGYVFFYVHFYVLRTHKLWMRTCSSSCRSRCSWDSSCLLWSSRICIRASSRPLCWRSSLASAMSSASRALWGDTGSISGGDGSGERPFLSWAFFRRSYSDCNFLRREWRGWKFLYYWLYRGHWGHCYNKVCNTKINNNVCLNKARWLR